MDRKPKAYTPERTTVKVSIHTAHYGSILKLRHHFKKSLIN